MFIHNVRVLHTKTTVFMAVVFGCVYSGEEIPVPIPNTEVKLACGDGTALLSVGE